MNEVKLDNGIVIRKMCASCKYKTDDYPYRRCRGGKVVDPQHCCERWEVHERFKGAQLGRGSVKSKDYLMFAHEFALENESLPIDERIPVLRIRAKYKRITKKNIFAL